MQSSLFVCFSAPETGVFESQVLEYGKLVQSFGIGFEYLLFEGLRARMRDGHRLRERVGQLRQRFGVDMKMSYVPTPLGRAGLGLAALHIAAVARRKADGRLLVQARGPAAACAAALARPLIGDMALLYDARGDSAAEARLDGQLAGTAAERDRWERRARRFEVLERSAVESADHILAVSSALRTRLCELSSISAQRVTVVPCCADPDRLARPVSVRERMRRSLAVADRFTVVYSGSLGSYQIPGAIAALIGALRERIPNLHFLVLTRDQAEARRCFGRFEEAGFTTIQASAFDEVGDYLAAADAALLLRVDDEVNRVACPVKFAEYQLAGLPVILTPGIGDVSGYVAETGHGTVVDLRDPAERQAADVARDIEERRWPDRHTIRQRALRTFSREAHRHAYRRVLEQLGILREAAHAA